MSDNMTHVSSFATESPSGFRWRLENWAEGISEEYVSLVYEEWDGPENQWSEKTKIDVSLDDLTKMVKMMNLVLEKE